MKLVIVLLLILVTIRARAQHMASTFQALENTEYSMQKLDSIYPNALSDTGKAIFKGQDQQKFAKVYQRMIYDLVNYLSKNKFLWGRSVRIFNKIYFSPDGSVDYFLVNLVNTGIDDNKQQKFLLLLNKFIKTYKINIKANSRFAQCSPVLFQDIK